MNKIQQYFIFVFAHKYDLYYHDKLMFGICIQKVDGNTRVYVTCIIPLEKAEINAFIGV